VKLRGKVGPKGQAVIPKEIREVLGIEPGSEVLFEMTEGGVILKKYSEKSGAQELANVIPRKEKLRREADFKRLMLSEARERWST